MIKFIDILKESDDNIFIPRGSKEEKDKVLIRKEYDKIQEYIKNGSEGDLVLRGSPIKFLPRNLTKVGGSLILLYSQIEKLPDNLIVNGNLDLDKCKNLKSLPDNLTVNGFLDLDSCKNLESLPNGLKVKIFLDLRNTNITSLPSDLEVGGSLILIDTPIEKLPDNLTVNGRLDLDSCKNLKSLPNGLKVTNLDLQRTNITFLPSDLEVVGDLFLDYTPIANMYTKEQIREMAPGVKGRIKL